MVETLALGLARVTPGNGASRVVPGAADFWLAEQADPAAEAVFRTIAAGLADLAASYPRFVRFEDRTGLPGGGRTPVRRHRAVKTGRAQP